MEKEIEATFTQINKESVRTKLTEIGATCVHPERLMRRQVYHPHTREGDWFRVRDEGDKVTMSYKKISNRSIDGVEEIALTVSNFETACLFLEKTGVIFSSYQETKRESWVLDGVEIEIDEWPWIPPFVEIEGASEEAVKLTADKLGFTWEHALFGSVENCYQEFYDVTDEDVDGWQEIVFSPVPEWLEQTRK